MIFRRCDGFVRIEEPGSYTLRFRISRDSNVDQAAMIDNVSFTLWEGDHGEVVVNNGGTLDVNAQPDFRTCHFVLNGGTLRNNGSSITTATNMVKIVRLATNSTIHAGNSFGLIGDGFSPATLFLDGHTLNATRGGSRALYLCDAMLVGGGTVEVPYTGWVQMGVDGKDEANYGVKASGIVFNIAGWQKLYSSIDVLDYNMTYTGTSNDGTGTYIVHGTFTPAVDVFSNCRMLDGSVIDLSERTTALPLVSNFSSGGNTLQFADGAAVGVKLGSRQIVKGTAVISWTAETSPDATVTFVRADADRKYRLVKESDGLYYYPLGGLMMIVR